MESHQNYYTFSIHPSCINISYRSLFPSGGSGKKFQLPGQFKNNKHQGRISIAAKRKIFRAIDYIVHLSSPKRVIGNPHGKYFTFRLGFFTLTLSSKQIHSDRIIMRRLINYFVTEMIRKWNVKQYIWRAEKQKNGNIHFHFIVGTFIPWNELRNTWNRVQQVLGYVTRYRENREIWHRDGFKYDHSKFPQWTYKDQLKAYKVGLRTDWNSPNSTDIHTVLHVGNVKAYLSKYVTKADQSGNMESRLWGCSYNLSNLQGGQDDVDSKYQEEFNMIIASKKSRVFSADWYTVFYIDTKLLLDLGCFLLLSIFEKFLQQRFPVRAP